MMEEMLDEINVWFDIGPWLRKITSMIFNVTVAVKVTNIFIQSESASKLVDH